MLLLYPFESGLPNNNSYDQLLNKIIVNIEEFKEVSTQCGGNHQLRKSVIYYITFIQHTELQWSFSKNYYRINKI